MARPLRVDEPGAVHHVFARGNDRRRIFIRDADRQIYLDTLARVVSWKRWRCLAYCLMDNHVHLVLETPYANLGRGMQRLHGRYAQEFNERHRRSGHLFQGRYGATRIVSDEHLLTALAYVVRNPVAAGLCAHPEEWPWGSHAALLDPPAPRWLDVLGLMARFLPWGGDPFERYLALVADPARGTLAP